VGSMSESIAEVLDLDGLGRTVNELVSMGCMFVVEGEVFQAMTELLEKLVRDGDADPQGVEFLLQLRAVLIQSSKPVRPKVVPPGEAKVQVVHSMPDSLKV
jgi:hypothetical protein